MRNFKLLYVGTTLLSRTERKSAHGRHERRGLGGDERDQEGGLRVRLRAEKGFDEGETLIPVAVLHSVYSTEDDKGAREKPAEKCCCCPKYFTAHGRLVVPLRHPAHSNVVENLHAAALPGSSLVCSQVSMPLLAHVAFTN